MLPCDWGTDSGNGCTVLGAGIGIGGVGIRIGLGMGRVTLGFLLIPAMPCPILDLGIGGTTFVGSLWTMDGI